MIKRFCRERGPLARSGRDARAPRADVFSMMSPDHASVDTLFYGAVLSAQWCAPMISLATEEELWRHLAALWLGLELTEQVYGAKNIKEWQWQ